ncbi:MAG: thiamine pyrophosphate-binding protein [Methylacidiphilales bacterium]|nr:thiamine pyrophosphate-binding protein [Candidatus Methylacidiphilales bacterium]
MRLDTSIAAGNSRIMIRLADYVAQTLVRHGVKHVFLVTGGGAMHLNDALGRCPGLDYVCCHHEQGCAIAAESYFRLTNRLAAVNVTTGPGGTNAITGVFGAHVDSLGMIVVSGQVKRETTVRGSGLPLRQLGDQEVDIIKMVEGISKYAVMVWEPETIRYHLEKALYLATHGRPGPTWIDIPGDVQGAQINPDKLAGFDPAKEGFASPDFVAIDQAIAVILEKIKIAKRPVIYAGSGIRLSKQYETFLQVIKKLGIPTVTAFNSSDLLWETHPCYAGLPGTIGNRAGNFTVQNADFLLVLGCRLNIRLVSYNWQNFARAAFKAIVDIDPLELQKPTIKPDLPVVADLADFLPRLLAAAPADESARHRDWLAQSKKWIARYPVVLPEYWKNAQQVNPYCFVDTLSSQLRENDVVVTGDGTASIVAFQASKIKKGQRLYHNSGSAPMGYDIPGALGAAIALGGKQRVICLAGDGSIMMNLQELQTIRSLNLPIKIFLFNNLGYHSIRQTQANFFADNIVGCGTDSGLSFPDFSKIADAFRFPFRRCASHADLEKMTHETLKGDGPQFCEVMLDLSQPFAPKLSSRRLNNGKMVSSPLEDMAPFLSRDELRENMFIPLMEE